MNRSISHRAFKHRTEEERKPILTVPGGEGNGAAFWRKRWMNFRFPA
jgi:hypothetical protein